MYVATNITINAPYIFKPDHYVLQAHERDSASGTGHGIYTFKHRWLLVTEESFLPRVEAISGDITHVTVLSFPNLLNCSWESSTTAFISRQVRFLNVTT